MLTLSELLQFCLVIIGLVNLFLLIQEHNDKKK